MNKLKALYLLSATTVILCLGCEEPPVAEQSEYYISQKDIDELKRENIDSSGNILFTRGELKGMKLFMHHCNRCHPGGEKGKGPSLVDKKILPDFLIHFQIRNGLGDMPAFKEKDISKEERQENNIVREITPGKLRTALVSSSTRFVQKIPLNLNKQDKTLA